MSEQLSGAEESRLSRAEDNKRKRDYWSSHIERWQESGLSQSDYCRENDLKDHQFVYWKKRIIQAEETAVRFVSLNLDPLTNKQPLQGPGCTLRLVVSNGLKIEVEAGFDPNLLKQLIIALRGV
jgi:hypothetical protein